MHRRLQNGQLTHSSLPNVQNSGPSNRSGFRPESYYNPHTSPRKKDILSHYKIGDIYDRFDGLKKGTFARYQPSDGPYLRYLKKLSRNGWSNLLYLVDFMEISTVPVKQYLLSKADFKERYSRTDVTILDLDRSGELTAKRVTSTSELSEVLEVSTWKDEPRSMRLILCSDVSSSTIEALGSNYDVDPRVFRGYLTDYQWFHVRDPWYNCPPFKSSINKSTFFSVVHPRLFYLPDEASVKKIDAAAGSFNVQRSVLLDTMGSWTEPEDSRIGNLRSTMAFWSRPELSGKGSLADVAPPSMNEPIPESMGQESMIEDFVRTAQEYMIERKGKGVLPIDLVAIQMRTIAGHWRVFMQHAETRLSIIEWVLQPPNPETSRSLEETLEQLHPWRRRIPLYRNILARTIHICSDQSSKHPNSCLWADLATDFQDLEFQRSLLEARVDRITSTMTAIMAIDENKKATGSADDVARITYLAFVFVPLSFLTGIFSMDRGFPEGGTMVYWVFAILGVPMAGIPMLVALNWERIRGWWESVKRGRN